MKGHKFQVVLVRTNAKVGGARLCFGRTDLVRNKEVDIRVHKLIKREQVHCRKNLCQLLIYGEPPLDFN